MSKSQSDQASRAKCYVLALTVVLFVTPCSATADPSVARLWNEALLSAIRLDTPRPTVHSRNLHHTSAAMFDAWSTFDTESQGVFFTEKNSAQNVEFARNAAISYAAYRVLSQRYSLARDPLASQAIFDDLMDQLGLDPDYTNTLGNDPRAIGNRVAQKVLADSIDDGANELEGYFDYTGYVSVNTPMITEFPTVTNDSFDPLADPNRWQQLYIDSRTNQSGFPEPSNLQEYIGPQWGNVATFALESTGGGPHPWSDLDPGAPPQLNGAGDAEYRDNTMLVIRYSNSLDPNQGLGAQTINISPNTAGNRPLGTHDDNGYSVNPHTGQPYADNYVLLADYGRVLAEFWADGPESETPPGHWNVIANEVSDHPLLEKRIGGQGPIVNDLEWDTKVYLALNGAGHDAAVAAWGMKREYDYSRPITMIRYQGSLGQSSDPAGPSYHEDGLRLESELIEVVTAETIAEGGKHRNAYLNANRDHLGDFFEFFTEQELVGKIVINAWNHEPPDPETQVSGVDWILAENWVPYQNDNFVTPAFPAYTSGHSTFSRAAAEVMALITGDEYFPGGLGEMIFETDFLEFEHGPSEDITLQWATYFDAADEAGISRLWGGIHVPPDDFVGRVMGSSIGIGAYERALTYFGEVVPEPSSIALLGFVVPLAALRSRTRDRHRRVSMANSDT